MDDWKHMTASDLGRGIEYGEIDPIALTETFLEAIETHGARDMIYARVTADRARAEAAGAAERAKAGLRRGLLDGVPISWKDLFDSKGIATEAGSAFLKDRVPDEDAVVLRNATEAGLVCLGKTHMTELAFSGLGVNPITATPPNTFDASLAPGGSSSGAGSSVGHGLAAIGIGSDTGGSVRIPAAWNDLVGLKTTSGYLSGEGVVPLCARFDTVGPLCRSVEDAARITAAMAAEPPADITGAKLRGMRLAVCETLALDDCDPGILSAFEANVRALADAGATIDMKRLPQVTEAAALAPILFTTEAYGTWKDRIEPEGDKMYPPVRDRFLAGKGHSGADYVKAWQLLDALRKDFAIATAGYDGIILPTTPVLPPKVADLLGDADLFTAQNLLALRNTRIGNNMGLCAITLPTKVTHAGLMIFGKPFGDAALLRVGAAAEEALAN